MPKVGEREEGEALLSDLKKEKKTLRGSSPSSIQPSFQYRSPPPLPCIFLSLYFSLLVILDPPFQQNRAEHAKGWQREKALRYCSWKRKVCTAPSGFWPVWWEARFQLLPVVAGYKECQKAGKGGGFPSV